MEYEAVKGCFKELQEYKEIDFIIEPRQGSVIRQLRNSFINDQKSCKRYQEPIEGIDAYLMIDSDINITLKDILLMISHDKYIVTLPYLSHESDETYQTGVFSRVEGNIGGRFNTRKKGLHKVDWCGAGAMLIDARVFKKTEYPWFRHSMLQVDDLQEETGEDVGFCINARKSGFDIWCDFDNPVKHLPRNKNFDLE